MPKPARPGRCVTPTPSRRRSIRRRSDSSPAAAGLAGLLAAAALGAVGLVGVGLATLGPAVLAWLARLVSGAAVTP